MKAFIDLNLRGILSILESSQQNYNKNINYLFIIILYLQVGGFVLSNYEIKKLDEPLISYFARFNEISTGTFLVQKYYFKPKFYM
jgi:hypothetical protein